MPEPDIGSGSFFIKLNVFFRNRDIGLSQPASTFVFVIKPKQKTIMKLKVHLTFPGTCEEALNFYNNALDGEITFLFRKKEDTEQQFAGADKNKISHMIVTTPEFELSGEDLNSDQKAAAGNNTKLILSFYDIDKCRTVFDLFAKGATVTMPFQKTFFCDGMGELTDKYGISWIIMMNDDGYQG